MAMADAKRAVVADDADAGAVAADDGRRAAVETALGAADCFAAVLDETLFTDCSSALLFIELTLGTEG